MLPAATSKVSALPHIDSSHPFMVHTGEQLNYMYSLSSLILDVLHLVCDDTITAITAVDSTPCRFEAKAKC
ncbi:hypothetical protein AcW2_004364 [Taiwanofungus camphoratus]|nr:hypothetical protein AcW2_004364 [Antrodia cinnamomea]